MLHAPTISTISTTELRPTHLEVDLGVLAGNYRAIAAHVSPARVMPILKANAYGHGLVEVAQTLERLGAPIIGVAYLEEGLRIRQQGVRLPVLVMSGIVGEQIPAFLRHDLRLTASSVDKLHAIDAAAAALGQTAHVHLKIDTGMERIGVHWYSADSLLEASLACKHVHVEGIFTHLANADTPDLSDAKRQLDRFSEVLRFYERRSLPMPLRHAASSGAIEALPESGLDLVRPGILFYGARPSASTPRIIAVRGALRWVTRVVFFKVVQPGHGISYGSTYRPDALARVVTLPVGYGDGYMRAMSGRAHVLLRGHRYPVVGRICMDQVMVSIGWSSAYNGDEAVLLGRMGDLEITAEDLAAWAGTIPHEVLCSINTRVPRLYHSAP